MNKKVLPAIYSAAVWCLFVVLLFFWLYCVTTVTPFIERSVKGVTVVTQLMVFTVTSSDCKVKKARFYEFLFTPG